MTQKNRKRTLEHQNSMVVKKYGSMVNTLESSSFGGVAIMIDAPNSSMMGGQESGSNDAKAGKSSRRETTQNVMDTDDTELQETPPPAVQEQNTYQGQKFDLIGFSDYFPFGLKQVYAAASSLNQMLQ